MTINNITLKRHVEKLERMLEKIQGRLSRQFGQSPYCILGNDREHNKWVQIKYNEPTLMNQDDEGILLLPTWDFLSKDLYSALHRVQTVLYDKNQIAARYQGNRGLLSEVLTTDEWERIHDTTMGDDNSCIIAALRIQAAWLERLRQEQEEQESKRKENDRSADDPGDRGSINSPQSGLSDQICDGGGETTTSEKGTDSGDNLGDDLGRPGTSAKEMDNNKEGGQDEEGDQEPEGEYVPTPEANNDLDSYEAGVDAEEALKTALDAAKDIDTEEALEEAMTALKKAQSAVDKLEDMAAYDELVADTISPSDVVRKAAQLANSEVKDHAQRLYSWGAEQAVLRRMDPKEALELSKLLRETKDLQKIAELIGSNRIAIQKRKTRDRLAHGPTLRMGIEHGNNVNKLVNSQKLQMLVAPGLFKWNFINKSLRQYKTRIEEIQERGTGVLWVDSSGSMSGGSPFTYSQVAKATCISIMEYFHSEGRYCIVGLFDHGVRSIVEIPADISEVDFLKLKVKIASDNYGGGTDYYHPLVAGFAKIKESPYLEKSDQVLITDGECLLSEDEVNHLRDLQEELNVTIQTVLMPGGAAGQMEQFGPVENVNTSLRDANKLALDIVQRMDDHYDETKS